MLISSKKEFEGRVTGFYSTIIHDHVLPRAIRAIPTVMPLYSCTVHYRGVSETLCINFFFSIHRGKHRDLELFYIFAFKLPGC
jgi:hypothetical protein